MTDPRKVAHRLMGIEHICFWCRHWDIPPSAPKPGLGWCSATGWSRCEVDGSNCVEFSLRLKGENPERD